MCYINSAVNPFIFYTMSQAFKKQVDKIEMKKKTFHLLLNLLLSSSRGSCGVTALKSSLAGREFYCHQLEFDQKRKKGDENGKFHLPFWRNAADKLDFLNTTRGQIWK